MDKKTIFSGVLSRWLDRTGTSVRQLSLSSGVHDSDLSRIKEGVRKRITRESLGKLVNSELLNNNDRLEFIRAFLKDEVPEGELREGESFADLTEISFPRASVTLSELTPLDEALTFFRSFAEKDRNCYDWLIGMRNLLRK
jgi:hypothetical protein